MGSYLFDLAACEFLLPEGVCCLSAPSLLLDDRLLEEHTAVKGLRTVSSERFKILGYRASR
jgi:hypothetical protein